jgi:hypothetical protein
MLGCFLPPSLPLRENDEPRVARTRIGWGRLKYIARLKRVARPSLAEQKAGNPDHRPEGLSHFATVRVLVGTTHQPVHRYLAAMT